jgi:curved DNA-binding protein CbpA
MNPYEELGIPPDADEATIKKAYRRAARKAHPDRGGNDKQMTVVNQAYAILTDPERRERFDKTGRADSQPRPPKELRALNDIMGAMMMLLNSTPAVALDSIDLIERVREAMANAKLRKQAEKRQAREVPELLEKLRKRTQGGPLFNQLWENLELQSRDAIVEIDDSIEIINLGLQLLDGYSMPVESVADAFGRSMDPIARMMRDMRNL